MKRKNLIVLGSGLVGRPMALDLAADNTFTVTIADIDPNKLSGLEQYGIQTITADLRDKNRLVKMIW
jgi:saccharopine dehydrogenase-like NADP-dependent oxidoreductase